MLCEIWSSRDFFFCFAFLIELLYLFFVSLINSDAVSILFLACVAGVRKGRGRELGRETTRDGFLLLYDVNRSKNPDFPYQNYEHFDLERLDEKMSDIIHWTSI